MINKNLKNQRKIAVFDVEGVLMPKNRYLVFELGRNLGLAKFLRLLVIGGFYSLGFFSLENALRRIFRLFQGFAVEELIRIFKEVPLLPSTKQAFSEIRRLGLKTALISSGLPQVVVDSLADRLNADYAFGLQLEIEQGILTGNIEGVVIKKNGKASVMKKILIQEKLTEKDCIVVADDRNNLPIFYQETLKIGYNPDFLITLRSDYVIENDLSAILSILKETPKRRQMHIPSNEVIRETIHASSVLVIPVSMYIGVSTTIILLLLAIAIFAIAEIARISGKHFPLIHSITYKAASSSESLEFATAPIFLALGIIFSFSLFPTRINYAAIMMLSVGDSAAAILGRLFGKTPFPFNKRKHLEGFLGGWAFSFISTLLVIPPFQALVGSTVGMLIEVLPLPINDNLSIPMTTGAILVLLSMLL